MTFPQLPTVRATTVTSPLSRSISRRRMLGLIGATTVVGAVAATQLSTNAASAAVITPNPPDYRGILGVL